MTDKKDGTEKARVFVYGTLLAGDVNEHRLSDAELLGLAELSGKFKMLDLGPFPAAVETEDMNEDGIRGEVYEVTYETLYGSLDRLESVDALDPEDKTGRGHGLYYRREFNVAVKVGNGVEIVKAWVYLMRADRVRRSAEPIESGDWREHCGDVM